MISPGLPITNGRSCDAGSCQSAPAFLPLALPDLPAFFFVRAPLALGTSGPAGRSNTAPSRPVCGDALRFAPLAPPMPLFLLPAFRAAARPFP